MYNFKKLLCLILAVSTILSCFSVTAFADEAEGENVLLSAPADSATTEDETLLQEATEEIVVETTEEIEVDVTDFEKVSDEEWTITT